MADFQVVKYKAGKQNFEVLTRPGTVLKFRAGAIGFDHVLASDEVYKNHHKGERASAEDLKAAFGTENAGECAKQIVTKGDLELTATERREAVEKKRAEVVNYIHKYYIDPKNKTPHPVTRISNALDQLKIKIDGDIPAERQVQDIVKRLPEVLAVRKSEMEGSVTVPHKFVAQASGLLKKMVQIKGESYGTDGCTYQVSFVPGDYQPLTNELQKLTQGDFQFDVEGQELAATQEETGHKGKKGGAAKKAAAKK